jgi:hypothetical protein
MARKSIDPRSAFAAARERHLGLTARIRQRLAARRLARLVEAARRDPRTQEFVRRRNAALRHTPKPVLPHA